MDKEYEQLLSTARANFDSFSLVWQDQFKFNESAAEFEKLLEQFLVNEQYTDEWPGTKIFGAKARVKTYKVNSGSLSVLSQVKNVFEFVCPNYPEDLAFYYKGRVKFTSIAHEGEAWYEET
jgi:hypothetical protein